MNFKNLLPTKINNVKIKNSRGVAQLASAFGSGPKGRWFKSSRPDQYLEIENQRICDLLFKKRNTKKIVETGFHSRLNGKSDSNAILDLLYMM